MSEFDDFIRAGLNETAAVAGERCMLSQHTGVFTAVFRGEENDIEHEMGGHDSPATEAATIEADQFASIDPPLVDEILTRESDGVTFTVVSVERAHLTCYDLMLTQRHRDA